MNIDKYEDNDSDDQYKRPQKVREDLKNLLNMVEHSNITNPGAVNTYNLLCRVEALLRRYETASRETLFAIRLMSNREECCNYLVRLHSCVMNESVRFCPMKENE